MNVMKKLHKYSNELNQIKLALDERLQRVSKTDREVCIPSPYWLVDSC